MRGPFPNNFRKRVEIMKLLVMQFPCVTFITSLPAQERNFYFKRDI